MESVVRVLALILFLSLASGRHLGSRALHLSCRRGRAPKQMEKDKYDCSEWAEMQDRASIP